MKENSSSPSSTPHHGLTAEAISRRAYELWEKEGRPENSDLHHWLRAEKELLAEQSSGSGQMDSGSTRSPENTSRSDDGDWLRPEKDLLQQNQSAGGTTATATPTRQANTDRPMQSTRNPTNKPPMKKGGPVGRG